MHRREVRLGRERERLRRLRRTGEVLALLEGIGFASVVGAVLVNGGLSTVSGTGERLLSLVGMITAAAACGTLALAFLVADRDPEMPERHRRSWMLGLVVLNVIAAPLFFTIGFLRRRGRPAPVIGHVRDAHS